MQLHDWRRITYRGGLGLTVGVFVLTSTMALRAQGRGGGAPAGPVLVPLTAASLESHPDLYIGQTVAVTATVEKNLNGTAFTVDQDKTKSTKDVLVIAPNMTGTLDLNSYVTVIGEAVMFDPATVATKLKGYTLSLAPDVIEKYRGKAAILATSVINAAMADVAKKVPPPMSPAEVEFSKVMKQVSPTFTALRQATEGSDAAAVKAKTADLKKFFADTQAFFKTRGTADATGWAGDAAKLVADIETAGATGTWDAAKASATTLNTLCGTCHTAHRERLDDGTFRVK